MTENDRIETAKDTFDDSVVEYCCSVRDFGARANYTLESHARMLADHKTWSELVYKENN